MRGFKKFLPAPHPEQNSEASPKSKAKDLLYETLPCRQAGIRPAGSLRVTLDKKT